MLSLNVLREEDLNFWFYSIFENNTRIELLKTIQSHLGIFHSTTCDWLPWPLDPPRTGDLGLCRDTKMPWFFVSHLCTIKFKSSIINYANNLPSETWINWQEAPKLHSPLRNFLQYGGSLVGQFEPPDWPIGDVLALEPGTDGFRWILYFRPLLEIEELLKYRGLE